MYKKQRIGIGVLLCWSASHLHAAGFYLKEQSIVSQGQAFAGVAAQSGLASATYFNPAGLHSIEEKSFEGGVHLLVLDQEVSNNGTTDIGINCCKNKFIYRFVI